MDRPATHVQRDWLRSIAAGACAALLTWELPLPREVIMSPIIDSQRVSDEGTALLVPWFLSRGGRLNMHHLLKRLCFESAPEHIPRIGWTGFTESIR